MVEECRLPVRFLVLVFVCNFFSCCIFCNLLPQIIDTISKKPARHVTAKSCELKTLPALHCFTCQALLSAWHVKRQQHRMMRSFTEVTPCTIPVGLPEKIHLSMVEQTRSSHLKKDFKNRPLINHLSLSKTKNRL